MGNSYRQPQVQPSFNSRVFKTGDISLGVGLYESLVGEKFMGREIDIPNEDYKQCLLKSIARKQSRKSQLIFSIVKYFFKEDSTMCSSQERCLILSKMPDYCLEKLFNKKKNRQEQFSIPQIHYIVERVVLGLQAQELANETFHPIDMSSIVYCEQKVYLLDTILMGNDAEYPNLKGKYPSPEILQNNIFTTANLDHLGSHLFSLGIMAIDLVYLGNAVQKIYENKNKQGDIKTINKLQLKQVINSISDRFLKEKIQILTQSNPALRKDIYQFIRSQSIKKISQMPLGQSCITNNSYRLQKQASKDANHKTNSLIQPIKMILPSQQSQRPSIHKQLLASSQKIPVLKPTTINKNNISIFITKKITEQNSPSTANSRQTKLSSSKETTFSSKKSQGFNKTILYNNLITPKKLYLKQQFSTIKQVTEYDDASDSKIHSSLKSLQLSGKYDGRFVKGKREGFGKFVFPEGSFYEGYWKNDQMHGFGKLYYSNGAIAYEGQWYCNQFHGKGKVYALAPTQLLFPFDYRDFNKLQDEWVTYEGELIRDQKHGWGLLTLSNGQKYSGLFQQDLMEGEGSFWREDGSIITGLWKGGKLIQKNLR